MKLILIEPEELKTLITEAVTVAVNESLQNLKSISETEEILRRKDVAKELKVSLVTVSQWMKDGKLPYHRIASRIFFKRSEILEAMQLPLKYRRR